MRWTLILAVVFAAAGLAVADGPDGSALQFDGVDDWVDFGSGPAANAPFTIEAWVKPTQASTQPQLIAGPFGASGGCYQGAGFRLLASADATPGALAFVVGLKGCGNDDQINGPVPTLGQWYHLAGTYDGSTMRFYVDGSLVGELTNIDYTKFGHLAVGGAYSESIGGPEFFFKGEIDELRMWDYARTESEIDSTKSDSLNGDETGLMGYWSFDEGDGQVANETVAGVENGRLGDSVDADDADPVWVSVGEPPVSTEEAATVEDAIEELIQTVQDLDLKRHTERKLTKRLEIALKLLRDDNAANDRAAAVQVCVFAWTVSGPRGWGIPSDVAEELASSARDIVQQILDGGSLKGHKCKCNGAGHGHHYGKHKHHGRRHH